VAHRPGQPRLRNSPGHASNGSAAQPPPRRAPAHRPSPPKPNRPSIPMTIRAGTPSGQGWTGTYGPPSAHAPPMSSTARMPRNSHVMHAASPAAATSSQAIARRSAVRSSPVESTLTPPAAPLLPDPSVIAVAPRRGGRG
jgi:hypothetical protein